MAAQVSTLQNPRLRTLTIPREHGAWGMLLVPLATGAVIGLHSTANLNALALFIVAAMSLFWLRTPIESWLGMSAIKAQTKAERRLVLKVFLAAGALAIVSIASLLAAGRAPGLLLIGVIAGFAFAAQAVVKKLGRKGRMPAQIIGAIGLTSTAAGAYYVAAGRLDRIALGLWLANWVFAGNQIHFVQLRIHSSRAVTFQEKFRQGRSFVLGQVALIVAIVAACRIGLFSVAIAFAFVPVLLRGAIWFMRGRQPLNVHKLGFAELAQALLFATLLCIACLT